MTFQFNKPVSGEEYDRWKQYLESKDSHAIVLPDYIDVIDNNNSDLFVVGDE